jgi:GTPase SAR1 family protein
MCDISKRDSITNIDKWLLKFNEGSNIRNPKFPVLIVAGKLDLEEQRSFNKKDIETYLTVMEEFDYLECSSKTGENVDLLFQTIVDKMLIHGDIQPPTR